MNALPDGYLDAASTEPLHPAAREAWAAALEAGWADPARLYRDGRRARLRLDAAREVVARVLGVDPDEVHFPSSGSRAVIAGVLGALRGRARVGTQVVASAVEHSSVLRALDQHRGGGGEAQLVGVDPTGRVAATEFAAALRPDTALAVLQSANQEVGAIQPVTEVAAACAERGVPLLVDAAQSVGRGPVPEGWALLCASAHKWGGPPGVGVLAVRRGTRWRAPWPDEGFVNLPAIAGAAASLAAVAGEATRESARLRGLLDRIRSAVMALPDVVVHGDPRHTLPHVLTFSCLYLDGESLVTALDREGFAVNSGSACTADTLRPSHVLEAMGVISHGNVRVSLPRGVHEATVARFLAVLPEVLDRLRREGGVDGL